MPEPVPVPTSRAPVTKPGQERETRQDALLHERASHMDVSEAEACVIGTLRAVLRASQNRDAYAEWEAWEVLKNEVAASRRGVSPCTYETEQEPALHHAVAAVCAYLDSQINHSNIATRPTRPAIINGERMVKDL